MEGFLQVPKSGAWRSDRQRFVILDDTRAAICWGKSREAAAAASAKKLPFADIVDADVTGTPGEVRVQARKRVHLFRAESDDVARKWVRAVRSRVPPARPPKPSAADAAGASGAPASEVARLAAAGAALLGVIAALLWLTPSVERSVSPPPPPPRPVLERAPIRAVSVPRGDMLPAMSARAAQGPSLVGTVAVLVLLLACAALAVALRKRLPADLHAARRALQSAFARKGGESARSSAGQRRSGGRRRGSGRPAPILIPERALDAEKRAEIAARLLAQHTGAPMPQKRASLPQNRASLPRPLAARPEVALALGAALERRMPPRALRPDEQDPQQQEQQDEAARRPKRVSRRMDAAAVAAANPVFVGESEPAPAAADVAAESASPRRAGKSSSKLQAPAAEPSERRSLLGLLMGSPRARSKSKGKGKGQPTDADGGKRASTKRGGGGSAAAAGAGPAARDEGIARRTSSKRTSVRPDPEPAVGESDAGARLRAAGAAYGKYARMLQSGVPEGAVRNAMARDGVKEPRGVFGGDDDALYAAAPKPKVKPARRRSPPKPAGDSGSGRQLPQVRNKGESRAQMLAAVGGSSSGSIIDELRSRQERMGLRRGQSRENNDDA